VDDGTALTGLDSSRREPGHGLSVNLELTDVAAPGLDKGRAGGRWQWNPSKETAASLVAEGNIPIREIAQQVGVSEKTIDRWKQPPAFRTRVEEIVANFREQCGYDEPADTTSPTASARGQRRPGTIHPGERPHAKRPRST